MMKTAVCCILILAHGLTLVAPQLLPINAISVEWLGMKKATETVPDASTRPPLINEEDLKNPHVQKIILKALANNESTDAVTTVYVVLAVFLPVVVLVAALALYLCCVRREQAGKDVEKAESHPSIRAQRVMSRLSSDLSGFTQSEPGGGRYMGRVSSLGSSLYGSTK